MNLKTRPQGGSRRRGYRGCGAAGLAGDEPGTPRPAKVTVAKVERGTLVASTFGIGTVEARRGYAIGPTVASRVLRVLVDQGEPVKAGQLVAELDPGGPGRAA